MVDNRVNINTNRLSNIAKVAKRTIDVLVNSTGEGILSRPKSGAAFESFNKNMDDIITTKLREKFKII